MAFVLTPHRKFPPHAIDKVEVDIHMTNGRGMLLTYRVYGAVPMLPQPSSPWRAEALWKTTCFELFLRPFGGGYAEFNFSPSSQWAAYAFDGYRDGMRDVPLDVAPFIEAIEPESGVAYTIVVDVDVSSFSHGPLQANLAAVIEESDGTKSFWALAHPADKPDFHDPACFVLQLPAAE